jgi:DNA-binding GntR family transcriptional regulator
MSAGPLTVKNKNPRHRMAADGGDGRHGAAVARIADTIRDRIRHGGYVAGQRLVEADLVRDFGVGRGTIREALRRLAAERMLELTPNRGASVPGLTRTDVIDLLQVLEGLVTEGAALAARRVGDPAVARGARRALGAVRAFARRPERRLSVADCMEENGRFHQTLVALSGNPLLERMVSQLQVHMFRLAYHNSSSPADRRRWTVNHEAILLAVVAGDSRRAASLMREYCRRIGSLLIELSFPPAP